MDSALFGLIVVGTGRGRLADLLLGGAHVFVAAISLRMGYFLLGRRRVFSFVQ
jgi:hypothetical protein